MTIEVNTKVICELLLNIKVTKFFRSENSLCAELLENAVKYWVETTWVIYFMSLF